MTDEAPNGQPRKNSRYVAANLLNDQADRFDKLAKSAGLSRNALFRLLASKLKLSDIQSLQNRS